MMMIKKHYKLEELKIKKVNGIPLTKGENISLGKYNSSYIHSNETRKKISKKNKGKKLSNETKKKIKDNNAKYWLGKKRSKETIEKMSKNLKGRPSAMKGCKHTQESKDKMSKSKKELFKIKPEIWTSKKHTEKTKHIISIKLRKYWNSLNIEEKRKSKETLLKMSLNHNSPGMLGKKQSKETKKKIGLAHKGKKMSKESREKMRISRLNYIMKRGITNSRYTNTKPELLMKKILNELKIDYKHNYPIRFIKHCYNADFFISFPIVPVIIEVDGNYWHNYPNGNEIDHIRNKELKEKGIAVFRFWENKFDIDKVEEILDGFKAGIQTLKNLNVEEK